AFAHARARRWELAVGTLASALERWPDNAALYTALARVWLDSAQAHDDSVDATKARETLDRVVATPAATSETLTLYGRALLEAGDAARAERTLLAATSRYPLDPNALLFYSTAAEHQNHLGAARTALIQYGALAPTDSDLAARAGRIAAISMRLNEPST